MTQETLEKRVGGALEEIELGVFVDPKYQGFLLRLIRDLWQELTRHRKVLSMDNYDYCVTKKASLQALQEQLTSTRQLLDSVQQTNQALLKKLMKQKEGDL